MDKQVRSSYSNHRWVIYTLHFFQRLFCRGSGPLDHGGLKTESDPLVFICSRCLRPWTLKFRGACSRKQDNVHPESRLVSVSSLQSRTIYSRNPPTVTTTTTSPLHQFLIVWGKFISVKFLSVVSLLGWEVSYFAAKSKLTALKDSSFRITLVARWTSSRLVVVSLLIRTHV